MELGSLETQLTAIMNSMSIIEHCYSQMKHNSYQAMPPTVCLLVCEAAMLQTSMQEFAALRHLVLKFARGSVRRTTQRASMFSPRFVACRAEHGSKGLYDAWI